MGQSITLDEIAWKPDGSYGLIVGYGSIVLKYDGSDFTILNTNLGFDPYDVEWKLDGSYALIVGSDGKITKYDGTSFTTLVSTTTNNLNKIGWKSDGSYALIVGASGTILKYDGASFTSISSNTTANLNAINWDVSYSNALIVGDSGTVLKYEASTSSVKWLGQSITLDEIAWKPDGSYGLVVGYGSIVLKYDGSDFTVLNTSLGFDPYDVEWKPDGSCALIVGSEGKITKYDGTSFTAITSPTTNNLNKISWRADGSSALIVGDSGTIYAYNGISFALIQSKTSNNLNAISWDNSSESALIIGDSGTVLRYDYGETNVKWLGESISLDEIAWKHDGSMGIVVGYGGIVLKYDGTDSVKLITGLSSDLHDAEWRHDDSYALIIGASGQVIKYDGSFFSSLTSGTTNTLYKVSWKPDDSIALIVGASGTILKYDGSSFATISTPEGISTNLNSVVWSLSGDYALIIGDSGVVLKYDASSGAVSWLGQSITLDEIAWKPDGSYGLIVGDGGIIMKYDGEDYFVLSTGLSTYMNDVDWKPDGSCALIVGKGGIVVKYDGTTFTSLTSGTTNDLCKVAWKPDGSYAVIIGASGVMLKWDGTDFTDISSGVSNNLNGVAWDIDGTYALIVGDSGVVLKYDGTITSLDSGTTRNLWDVNWKPDGSYALILSEYELLKFDGTTFTFQSLPRTHYQGSNIDWHPSGIYAIITNPSYAKISKYDGATFTEYSTRSRVRGVSWKPDGSYALLVGGGGQIIKFDGTNFVHLSSSIGSGLWDVNWKPDGSYALILSEYELLKFDGTTFTFQSLPISHYQSNIDWHPSGIYAIITNPNYRKISKYDGATFTEYSISLRSRDVSCTPDGSYFLIVGDSGSAWTFDAVSLVSLSTGVTDNLQAVSWKPDGSYALVVGASGTVLKYDGLWFTELSSGVTKELYSVDWSSDGSYALIVGEYVTGEYGTVLKYDGTSFTSLSSGVTTDLRKVACDSTSAMIVGDSGTMLKYDGTSFTKLETGTTANLNSVKYAIDGSYAIAVGDGGRVYKVLLGGGTDTTPPALTIASPADGTTVTTPTITVTGTASDGSGIANVKVDGVLATGTTSWSVNLTLTDGENTITVVATDGAGLSTTETITITYTPILDGKVLSGSTSAGIENATVTLAETGKTAQTGTNGYYSFSGVADGSYTLTTSKPGYIFSPVDVVVSGTTRALSIMGTIDTTVINAEITSTVMPSGSYKHGDSVEVTIIAKNTGTIEHTFYIGYSVRDPGDTFWDAPYVPVTLSPGDSVTETLSWTVQPGAPAGSYDVYTAVWAAQHWSHLYDDLDRENAYGVFSVQLGPEAIPGWTSYSAMRYDVLVDGKKYTAVWTVNNLNHRTSWMIYDTDGKVPDLTTFQRAAMTATVTRMIGSDTADEVESLRYTQERMNYFTGLTAWGGFSLWIRNTAAYLLGKFAIIWATGGTSLTTEMPASEALTVAGHAIAEEMSTKLVDDLKAMADPTLDESTIKSILSAYAVTNIQCSASKLGDAASTLEGHEGSWTYDEANSYYNNYKYGVIDGMTHMNLTYELQPGSDFVSQVSDVCNEAAKGMTYGIVDLDKLTVVEVANSIDDLGAVKSSAITREKYRNLFTVTDAEFGANAIELWNAYQTTDYIGGSLMCPGQLHAYDSEGRHVGINSTGGIDLEIPNSYYSGPDAEPEIIRIYTPQDDNITFSVDNATIGGTFNLMLGKQMNMTREAACYLNIPITETTAVSISTNNSSNPDHIMEIDSDGDGVVDDTVNPNTTETNHKPVSTINPPTQTVFTEGYSVSITGNGTDAEDGELPETALTWTSSIDGLIGSGSMLNTTNLSIGNHAIVLTATDSDGAMSMDSIEIQIHTALSDELIGDLNSDSILTPADAAIALEIAADSRPCDPTTLAAADVSGDGRVTSLDALMILQAAAGKIEL